MKHVQKFETFVNEEVPYNFDYSKNFETKWSESEIEDLKEMGATHIKEKTASIDEDDLIVFITKSQDGYKISPNKEIMTWENPLKSGARGEGGLGPEKGHFDRTRKIPTKLIIPYYCKDWEEAKKIVNLIFRSHKFGFDSI